MIILNYKLVLDIGPPKLCLPSFVLGSGERLKALEIRDVTNYTTCFAFSDGPLAPLLSVQSFEQARSVFGCQGQDESC